MSLPLIVRHLGMVDYVPTLAAMQAFTEQRTAATIDECWVLQHHPVFTQGLGGRAEHVLNPGDIPVIRTDRGGQVTYHGPGQLVIYCLFDLRRHAWGIRELVCRLEDSVIAWLAAYDVQVCGNRQAPGVYTLAGAKLASVGLRVRRGCCYHGLSINIAMDISPFQRINPCGFAGLPITQVCDLGVPLTPMQAADELLPWLCQSFAYAPEPPVSQGQDCTG